MSDSLCCFCLQATPDRRQRQSLLSQTLSAQERKQALAEYTRQVSPSLDVEIILSRSEKSYLCNDCGKLLISWNKLRVQLPAVQRKLSERLAPLPIPRADHSLAPSTPRSSRPPSVQHASSGLSWKRARQVQTSTPRSKSRRMDTRSPAVHVRYIFDFIKCT